MTVSRPLAKTPVTPSQVTAVRLVSGLSAAACFAVGAEPWWTWGALVFILSMVLDRADGDLARSTGRTSEWGHKFDILADAVCNAVVFIGLGVGLRGGEYGLLSIPLGFAAGLAVTAIVAMVMRAETLAGQRAGELDSFFGFDADDGMLAIPILVLFGFQEGLLIAAAVGAPVFAVGYFIWLRGRLAREAAASGEEGEGR